MKRLSLICCLLLAVSFYTSCLEAKEAATEVKLVSADEMQAILELEDVQLVDVRTSKEFDESHILNAQNIDFNSPTFDDDIEKLDKAKPVILYCKGGGRSAKCAEKLKDAGFKKIYDLEGGISKWQHSDKLKIERKS
ncbi:MAG: rhodanese-like domain-containing protein [Winogradskyella sp.]|uniref:rhodanese-like domain-containing protein n=1 Tax=Winogradskyella sp. TaxID=1883156 RepID=UPI00183E82CD|nr:rhodanese-like domain-containing protein [Winogradskyella sp.]